MVPLGRKSRSMVKLTMPTSPCTSSYVDQGACVEKSLHSIVAFRALSFAPVDPNRSSRSSDCAFAGSELRFMALASVIEAPKPPMICRLSSWSTVTLVSGHRPVRQSISDCVARRWLTSETTRCSASVLVATTRGKFSRCRSMV